MTTATEGSEIITRKSVEDIHAVGTQADEWWINEEWGFAVARFGKTVVNYEEYLGWYVAEMTEWGSAKRAEKDFAREVRLFIKANS